MILVIVGGLNWGLYGAFSFNFVQAIFGSNVVADIVYILVGLSALYLLVTIGGLCRRGGSMHKPDMGGQM